MSGRLTVARRILGSDTICMFNAGSTLGHRNPRPFGIDERPFWECEVIVHSSLQCRYAGFFSYDKESYHRSYHLIDQWYHALSKILNTLTMLNHIHDENAKLIRPRSHGIDADVCCCRSFCIWIKGRQRSSVGREVLCFYLRKWTLLQVENRI